MHSPNTAILLTLYVLLIWLSPPIKKRENVEISIVFSFFYVFEVENKNVVFSVLLMILKSKIKTFCVKIVLK